MKNLIFSLIFFFNNNNHFSNSNTIEFCSSCPCIRAKSFNNNEVSNFKEWKWFIFEDAIHGIACWSEDVALIGEFPEYLFFIVVECHIWKCVIEHDVVEISIHAFSNVVLHLCDFFVVLHQVGFCEWFFWVFFLSFAFRFLQIFLLIIVFVFKHNSPPINPGYQLNTVWCEEPPRLRNGNKALTKYFFSLFNCNFNYCTNFLKRYWSHTLMVFEV